MNLFSLFTLQLITFAVYIASFACVVVAVLRNHKRRLFLVAPAVWSIHGIVYYMAVVIYPFVDSIPNANEFFTIWSAVLRLHAAGTVLGGIIIYLVLSPDIKWTS